MTPGTNKRFLEAAYVTALPMAIGLAADLVQVPWLALAALPLLVLVPTLRKALATHEYFVTAGVTAAIAIAALTLVHDPAVWTRTWFLSLLGTGGLSSLICLCTGLKGKRGAHAVAFVLIHVALPIILVGSGMKALWKVEGMVPLHEGQASSTLHVMQNGRPTGETVELPFQVRLDRFRVEFYPERAVLLLFDARFRNPPEGQLDLKPGARLEAAGVTLVAHETQQITRMPSQAHENMQMTVASMELGDVPFEIPLLARQGEQAMPLPWGDQADVAPLVESMAKKLPADTPPRTLPDVLQTATIRIQVPESMVEDPAAWKVLLILSPDGKPACELPLAAKAEVSVAGTDSVLRFKGIETRPFTPMAADEPVQLTMAQLTVDDVPVVFPLFLERKEGRLDLPAGDNVTLADMVRASREFNSEPEGEVPALYEHLVALFQVVREPKMYQSRLSLLSAGGEVLETQEVLVNEPLRFDGWWLYQADWNPEDPSFSGIQAVYDPGLWVALAGLFLLAVGAILHVRRMIGGPSQPSPEIRQDAAAKQEAPEAGGAA